MIVKRNFSPFKVVPYVWVELGATAGLATAAWYAHTRVGLTGVALPFGPLGVMGTALAIFLGFRNNNAYARWWEARTLWSNVANNSRILARQIVSAVENARVAGKADAAVLDAYQRELVLRQVAFAHALRLHLRAQTEWEELAPLLPADELKRLRGAANRPNLLLLEQGNRLRHGVRAEVVGPFDPITLEPNLAALNQWQGGCERIKTTPLPHQYDFFTRVFLWGFLVLLPFSLLGLFEHPGSAWKSVPLSLGVAFVYAVVNKTAEVLETPFENGINDVPMTAITRAIERDLREMLGEGTLPPELHPEGGYLY